MGSNDMDYRNEQPIRPVTLSSFYMDTTEVTQKEYQALIGANPSHHQRCERCPVEQVSWFDAALFCNARSKREGLDSVYSYSGKNGAPGSTCHGLVDLAIDKTRNGYRLPTEAEWEYACRAGSSSDFNWGGNYPPKTADDTAAIHMHSVWAGNSQVTAEVASKKPNAWGLYDMSGNVREWCNDWYNDSSYSLSDTLNPAGVSGGHQRVIRGGSWFFGTKFMRSAFRSRTEPDRQDFNLGFRCVCSR